MGADRFRYLVSAAGNPPALVPAQSHLTGSCPVLQDRWYGGGVVPRTIVRLAAGVAAWAAAVAGPAAAAGPWIVTSAVTITEPAELGDVIVVGEGVLRVTGVGDPGARFAGNVIAMDGGRVTFEDSVIRFMSVYHGQYALVAWRGGEVSVRRCDYRVPSGVQHGIFAGEDGRVTLEDGDFGFVQLVPTGSSVMTARRLDGVFEVVVQGQASLLLEDIPRSGGGGELWVWPEFPTGCVARYTPPMPGFVDRWRFPPENSSGIGQSIVMNRCRAKLWPMLVRPGCDLTLAGIPPENWTVVGFHMPQSQTVTGLVNQDPDTTGLVPLSDRTVRLEDASIDTWNLYPEDGARIEVRDSVLGEVLAFGDSRVRIRDSMIDGTGGFLGASDRSAMRLERSTVTCDVQATGDATLTLSGCTVRPPDVPGFVVAIGAHDGARLMLAQTAVEGVETGRTAVTVTGRGVLGLAALAPPPSTVPAPGQAMALEGWAALYAVDPAVSGVSWTLEGRPACGLATPEPLGSGSANVENGPLGTWHGTADGRPWRLEMRLTDGIGRTLEASWNVPGRDGGGCAREGGRGRAGDR